MTKHDVCVVPVEFRVADTGDGLTVEGRAIPYMEVTESTPHGRELFEPGSLTRSVNNWQQSNRPLKVFRAHAHDRAIGHAVTFQDTEEGLDITVRLADTETGRGVADEVRHGLLDAFSIGFRAIRDRMVDGVRHVTEAALMEISLVPMPAYAGAQVVSIRTATPGPRIELPPAPDIPVHMLRNRRA